MTIKIAIVNDVLMAVEVLRRVVITVPDYQVAWIARDGAQAVTKCAQDTPDLILMDLLMPVMNGVEATRHIMQNSPCAILVVTASIKGNSSKVFEAMGHGALDVVSTPVLGKSGNPKAAQTLLAKIATIGKLIGKSSPKRLSQRKSLHSNLKRDAGTRGRGDAEKERFSSYVVNESSWKSNTKLHSDVVDRKGKADKAGSLSATPYQSSNPKGKLSPSPLGNQSSILRKSRRDNKEISAFIPKKPGFWTNALVVIGSSTGGPKALATILSNLPQSFRGAVVIIQHVDFQFARGLSEWLNQQITLPVELAQENSHLAPGRVLIAGTNDHLILRPNLRLKYTKEPRDYPYRPSVDVFFKSIAQNWPGQGTGVLLTGMGRDGAEGLSQLRSKGWHTIAQDRNTCIVYGMPKAAAELGAAVEILPLNAIAPAIIKQLAR
ncbi:MAG: chemotaxis response regulator protein-glutamate methylesterase [Symploca sp. SIO3E6]|nr:chemotaxis response regulator protein-glutamate methylesterase [Caldora sp. SIO3E6]